MSLVTKSITAENVFTDPIGIANETNDIAASISGTFVAVVTLQRSFDGITWHDLPTQYTSPNEVNIIPSSGVLYRAGVKTGDYTSGTVELSLDG